MSPVNRWFKIEDFNLYLSDCILIEIENFQKVVYKLTQSFHFLGYLLYHVPFPILYIIVMSILW